MAAGATIDNEDEIQSEAEQSPPQMSTGAPPPLTQGPTASPSQPAAPGGGQQPVAPTPAAKNPIEDQKGTIETGPKVKFDPKKLAKVQTAQDLVEAMRPKSRNEYMDWYEKQHGSINDHFDNLQKQMGQRPTDQGLSRQEKFGALLQFGLHLMKASSAPTPNQGAVLTGALSDEHEAMMQRHTQGVQQQQKDYDDRSNAIENARQEELKGIGTPAQAMAAQSKRNLDESVETKNNVSALKSANDIVEGRAAHQPPATYSTDAKGNVFSIERDEDGNPVAKPVLGPDGKPYQGKVLGRTSGSGIDKGDTAQIRNQRYLQNVLGVDPDTAAKVAFHAKSGNSQQDHKDIYRAILSSTMDPDTAKRGADQYVLENYGAGALSRQNAPLVSPQGKDAPPASAFQGIKPGQGIDFGPRGVWALRPNGQPYLVKPGSGPQKTNPIEGQ